jgi:hypothetical protein
MASSHKLDPAGFSGSLILVRVSYHLYVNYNTVKFANLTARMTVSVTDGDLNGTKKLKISAILTSLEVLFTFRPAFPKKNQKQACIFLKSVVYYHLSPLRTDVISGTRRY